MEGNGSNIGWKAVQHHQSLHQHNNVVIGTCKHTLLQHTHMFPSQPKEYLCQHFKAHLLINARGPVHPESNGRLACHLLATSQRFVIHSSPVLQNQINLQLHPLTWLLCGNIIKPPHLMVAGCIESQTKYFFLLPRIQKKEFFCWSLISISTVNPPTITDSYLIEINP